MIDQAKQILGTILAALFGSRNAKLLRPVEPLVAEVNALEDEVQRLSDAELKERFLALREDLREGKRRLHVYELEERARQAEEDGNVPVAEDLRKQTQRLRDSLLDEVLSRAFAMTREAAKRRIGQRHFDVQIAGGVVLHRGMIAEMVTGEGKTLVATLAGALNALDRDEAQSSAVHVVTVNDYLARRDAAWMGPVFDALGLTVGCIQQHMESSERIPEYDCDITYGTNNEFGFDYLRDNMKIDPHAQVQRCRTFAIVDEVDSALVDEARTPLIISGAAEESVDTYYRAERAVNILHGIEQNSIQPLIDKAIAEGIAKEYAPTVVQEDYDYVYSEEHNWAHLTDRGIEKCSKTLGVDDFYTPGNEAWPHFLENALKAKTLYKRDINYVVKENEVIIVDEFTGRLMAGRRWSDGLHQAVEASEHLPIRHENQTLATITFQNFFRLYSKLAGMTGTAMTEAKEFKQIYDLEPVSLPTNRPLRRDEHRDVIFGTLDEKFSAIVDEIAMVHKIGRPVLVGTVTIENSERLSQMLTRSGVKHEVLNAKYHEREAGIVALAGQLGRVTVATNMAGRGTDIVLGDFSWKELVEYWKTTGLAPKNLKLDSGTRREDVEHKLVRFWASELLGDGQPSEDVEATLAKLDEWWGERGMSPVRLCEGVAQLGGLHIVGTERHEARRIDNQLRGRAGRQGDPGTSRFFLSLEDDLMRIFASDTVRSLMRKLGLKEGIPIESKLVSNRIKGAQRRVEERNFGIRKRLLEYDRVMNEQRMLVYGRRQEILENRHLKERIFEMSESVVADAVDEYIDDSLPKAEWDTPGVINWCRRRLGIAFRPEVFEGKDKDGIVGTIFEAFSAAYAARESQLRDTGMRLLERYVQLDVIDRHWKDHLREMDRLKEGIWLRSYAQKDPVIEYKKEGYRLFADMMRGIYEDVTDRILKATISAEAVERELAGRWDISEVGRGELGGFGEREEMQKASERGGAEFVVTEPIRRKKRKVGRNEPCPCGSGKKYKNCCMKRGASNLTGKKT